MAEPADSAAVTAAVMLNDNRTVVGGKTTTGYRVAVLPTLPDGKTFTMQKADGTAASTPVVTAADATKAAIGTSTDVTRAVVPLDVATQVGGGNASSKYARKQLFRSYNITTGALTEKWCYTNAQMAPLDANGAPTTVALAVNAATTALTAAGQAVSNFAQPGPQPGVYQVSELQQGLSRYLGWTAQKP